MSALAAITDYCVRERLEIVGAYPCRIAEPPYPFTGSSIPRQHDSGFWVPNLDLALLCFPSAMR